MDDSPATVPAPWYETPKNYQSLLKWGQQLIDENKNDHIVCLGQSPAWIVKAAETINSNSTNSSLQFDYIPFSGNTHQTASKMHFHRDAKRAQPDADSLSHYRQLLSEHQLSPAAIIARHNNGQQTLIVEYTEIGRGLASFLSVLLDWAAQTGQQQALADSLKIANYSFGRVNATKDTTLHVDDHPPVAMRSHIVNNQLIFALRMNDSPDVSAQRFVPSYPHTSWKNPPVSLSENAATIASITQNLEQAAQVFIANSHGAAKS